MRRSRQDPARGRTSPVALGANRQSRPVDEDEQILHLSVNDHSAFVAAILDPPAPNASLKQAAATYRTLVKMPE